ncbi:MAG: hypothetical protein N2645_13880 [Clostridia bacterium]|nr:hypothetical protein [Clostridia bacterium]
MFFFGGITISIEYIRISIIFKNFAEMFKNIALGVNIGTTDFAVQKRNELVLCESRFISFLKINGRMDSTFLKALKRILISNIY